MTVEVDALGSPASNSLHGLCGRKATLNESTRYRAQHLRAHIPQGSRPKGLNAGSFCIGPAVKLVYFIFFVIFFRASPTITAAIWTVNGMVEGVGGCEQGISNLKKKYI